MCVNTAHARLVYNSHCHDLSKRRREGVRRGEITCSVRSLAIFSILLMPNHVTLCFLQGASIPDPNRRLKRGGNRRSRGSGSSERPRRPRNRRADEHGTLLHESPHRPQSKAQAHHQIDLRQAAAPPSHEGQVVGASPIGLCLAIKKKNQYALSSFLRLTHVQRVAASQLLATNF